MTRDQLVWWPR